MIKKIIFVTNIPSPYNLDLFSALASKVTLDVYFYNSIESERQWSLDINAGKYQAKVFSKDIVHSLFQKINRNLYFNFECIRVAIFSKADYYILSGNYYAPNTFFLLLILGLRRKKIAWYGEKLFPARTRLRKFVKRLLISPINICTDILFAVGNGARASYKSYGYRKNIFITPYAIDNSRFTKEQNSNEDKKSELFIFLSSGSLIERKGYDLAIGALNLVSDELKSRIEYWILGDGPLLNELKKSVSKNLVVRFMGFVEPSAIGSYFTQASAFLLTSRYDGWGVVVNEAIASALPVIVTNTCGASEYIDVNGGFVVNCDITEISQKIEWLVLNPELADEFSKYNLNKAKSISANSIAEIMLQHLTAL